MSTAGHLAEPIKTYRGGKYFLAQRICSAVYRRLRLCGPLGPCLQWFLMQLQGDQVTFSVPNSINSIGYREGTPVKNIKSTSPETFLLRRKFSSNINQPFLCASKDNQGNYTIYKRSFPLLWENLLIAFQIYITHITSSVTFSTIYQVLTVYQKKNVTISRETWYS